KPEKKRMRRRLSASSAITPRSHPSPSWAFASPCPRTPQVWSRSTPIRRSSTGLRSLFCHLTKVRPGKKPIEWRAPSHRPEPAKGTLLRVEDPRVVRDDPGLNARPFEAGGPFGGVVIALHEALVVRRNGGFDADCLRHPYAPVEEREFAFGRMGGEQADVGAEPGDGRREFFQIGE